MPDMTWLDEKHPVYKKWVATWKRNEMLLRGGSMVIEKELRRFDWEVPDAEMDRPFKSRIANAVYLNFGEMYLTTMSGHLLREAPRFDDDLSFGSLGKVKRSSSDADPTVAELIAYNVDGVGNDGSQWDNFWLAVWRRAGATGHRWLYVEAPAIPSESAQDQLLGMRPWLVEYSPIQVPNWHIANGVLQWAIVRTRVRSPVVTPNGTLSGNTSGRGYMLLVRAGVNDLGKDFSRGGWWLFDKDKKLTGGPFGQGNWDMTEGEIPFFPLFYERDYGRDSDDEMDAEPSLSRPGITELNNASVSYMNLSSAADFDAWDAAKSLIFLSNVGPAGWQLATEKILGGSRLVPLRGEEGGQAPGVIDSAAGATTANVFETRLERKLKEVRTVAMNEATLSPDASGTSRQMSFVEGKSPRLTLHASELEQAQNTAIMFLELRAGESSPSGVVLWTRNFDLLDVVESVQEVFTLEKLAGIASPTLRKKAMRRVVFTRGLASSDADLNKIEDEYGEVAKLVSDAKAQGLENAAKPPEEQPAPVPPVPPVPPKPPTSGAGG